MTQLRVLQGGRGWGRSYVTRSAKHAIQVTDLILQYAAGSLEEGGGLVSVTCSIQQVLQGPSVCHVSPPVLGQDGEGGVRDTSLQVLRGRGDVWHSMLQVLQGAECI